MSGLFGPDGRLIGQSQRFAHGADRSHYRGAQFPTQNLDIDKLIPAGDRKTLVSNSRRMFTNMGVPKTAIIQRADYSVGCAWMPTYGGSDSAGQEARGWLQNVWFPLCNVKGGMFDWWKTLNLISISADRDGDLFILLTRNDDGFPQVQIIPGHAVASKAGVDRVEKGPYVNARINDGVIYNRRNQAIAYRVNSGEPGDESFEDISARSLIHIFDPLYAEGGRGLPAFTHAIESLKHMLQASEYEQAKQLMISSIGLIEHNEQGGPDLSDPTFNISMDTSTSEGIATESYSGGQVRYFKANSGANLSTITSDSPGDAFESFHDRLTRAAVAGVPWSYSLAWKSAGQGTAERVEVEIARRAVTQRQRLLLYAAKRMTTYAVGAAPSLAMPGNMLSWGFTMPPRLTVDDGREAKALTESHRAGHTNETEIQGAKGRTLEIHYAERAEEAALKQLAKQAAEEKFNVVIDSREMGLLTPNEPATETPETPEPDAE